MGVPRRIDFVRCNRSFHLRYADANSFLDLGSYHQTVTGVCGVAKGNAVSVEHIFIQKGGNHSLMKMVILPYITCS